MEKAHFDRSGGRRSCNSRSSELLAYLVISITAACFVSVTPRSEFSAIAAQVDAAGEPAPIGFSNIVEKIKSTVVGVRVTLEEEGASNSESRERPPAPETPFGDFFRKFGSPAPETPLPRDEISLGSGFFVSGDGYIVTNYHVVKNGKTVEVTTDGGKVYLAKIIGTDPQTDVALLKITSSEDFSYVKFADAEPRTGDWVLAVGNPFGLGGTVTAGIVSAHGRDIGEGPYEDFIQIDAPVNKGNSGGPTFDIKGQVIGVNTAIYSPSGGFIGVAFDLPAETVKRVIQQLKERGHVTRGWIGVQVQQVTPMIAKAVGLKKTTGALVARVEPQGPAAKSGLGVGDVITAVNEQAVLDSRDLARKIAAIKPGTTVTLGFFREGKDSSLTVIVGELPTAEAQPSARGAAKEVASVGLRLVAVSEIAGAGQHGLLVTAVDANGPAAQAGIRPGDVILNVGNRAVDTLADFDKYLDQAHAKGSEAILLRVRREDEVGFVAIPIG